MLSYSSYYIPPRLHIAQFSIPIIDSDFEMPTGRDTFYVKITTPEKTYTTTAYNKYMEKGELQIVVKLSKELTGTLQLEVYTLSASETIPTPGFNNLVFKGYTSDRKESEIEVKTPEIVENTIIYESEQFK